MKQRMRETVKSEMKFLERNEIDKVRCRIEVNKYNKAQNCNYTRRSASEEAMISTVSTR